MLTQKKILVSENLKKRGNQGPLQCPLFNASEESASHIFLYSSYSAQIIPKTLSSFPRDSSKGDTMILFPSLLSLRRYIFGRVNEEYQKEYK